MASLNDYKRHIQVLKMEQKIGRIQKELETVDYGDECPFHGEDDCADVRKAYDRGYVNGLYEALTLFKLIEADTPQTETHDLHTNTHECVSDIPQMETVIDKDGDVWVRRDDEWYCIGHKEFPCETCKHNQQIGSICDDCTQSDDNPSNYEPQTERR